MSSTYIENIAVSYSDYPTPPDNCIKDLTMGNSDINAGFGGKYVWLIPKRTDSSSLAATYIRIDITDKPIPNQDDLAAGAGGKYRYLQLVHDHNENGIVKMALYCKPNSAGPVTLGEAVMLGFNRVSTDINYGRKGEYLHLVYSA